MTHDPTRRETILLVGHGSRDPRSARALARLAARVDARSAVPVELAFLELSEPSLEDALAHLSGRVRIVPLLLARAFHARDDLPGRVAAVTAARADLHVDIAGVLGPDPLLDAAVVARVATVAVELAAELAVEPAAGATAEPAAGATAEPADAVAGPAAGRRVDGLLLLGVGSSHASANAAVDAVAARAARALGIPAAAGFVTRGRTVEEAAALVRGAGASAPLVVPWFLAPGLLLDAGLARARELGLRSTEETLAATDAVARLVLARAAEADEGCHAA